MSKKRIVGVDELKNRLEINSYMVCHGTDMRAMDKGMTLNEMFRIIDNLANASGDK